MLAPHGEAEIFAQHLPPAPTRRHPLGTDQIGRDMLTRLIYGARNTVGIALVTTVLAFLLGGTLGLLAATVGGWLDQLLSRLVDVLMAIPQLIFALLILTIFGAVVAQHDPGHRGARLDAGLPPGPGRGDNIVVMDFVEAAQLRGEGLPYLIIREILPNAMAPLVAEFGLRFCFVFLTIAALSFLGLGIQPPTADWGSMVREMARLSRLRSSTCCRHHAADAGGGDRAADRRRQLRRRLDAAPLAG